MDQSPLITLTTDFGTADGYVGAMKGVILGIAPHARLVDVSHEIAPQNVHQAAYVLDTSYPFFPSRTVHLVVVDPGVGSHRRAIAVSSRVGRFVAPDNGVLSRVLAREEVEMVVELTEARYRLPLVSDTFHGRDIFAPAAAHLAVGVPMTDLGPVVADPVTVSLPGLTIGAEGVVGEVLHVDRFGNAVTNICRLSWRDALLSLDPESPVTGEAGPVSFSAPKARVSVGGRVIAGVHRTYAEVGLGEAVALVGSSGHLEIGIRSGNAALGLGLEPGMRVVVRY